MASTSRPEPRRKIFLESLKPYQTRRPADRANQAARKSMINNATAIRLDSPTPSDELPTANMPNIVIQPSIFLFSSRRSSFINPPGDGFFMGGNRHTYESTQRANLRRLRIHQFDVSTMPLGVQELPREGHTFQPRMDKASSARAANREVALPVPRHR